MISLSAVGWRGSFHRLVLRINFLFDFICFFINPISLARLKKRQRGQDQHHIEMLTY